MTKCRLPIVVYRLLFVARTARSQTSPSGPGAAKEIVTRPNRRTQLTIVITASVTILIVKNKTMLFWFVPGHLSHSAGTFVGIKVTKCQMNLLGAVARAPS